MRILLFVRSTPDTIQGIVAAAAQQHDRHGEGNPVSLANRIDIGASVQVMRHAEAVIRLLGLGQFEVGRESQVFIAGSLLGPGLLRNLRCRRLRSRCGVPPSYEEPDRSREKGSRL